ncbi:MAG: tRNA pseudouridine(54/55) synthase Pus10 [Candidatus Thermoplasmatota archaeon]|jgi:tRNA pseudouridine synthase 10|nr:tRNA pseudouridine(54/55) synthase Pus10 [Candidatus Thermoplasmatota archaeon]MCL5789330.1 tRNA pseudouridine(54/55) synthase Pus10 [Candidatus Thermoplasmatota archaeon]
MHLCQKCRERLSYHGEADAETHGVCDLCGGLLEHIEDYFNMFREEALQYEFSTFLIGVKARNDSIQKDIETIAKAGGKIRNYKEEFQFQLGSMIEERLHYRADFRKPELTFTVDQENMGFDVWVRPIYVKGRYLKKRRGIPQSPWIKPGRGKEAEKSVSEYIGQQVCDSFGGRNYNFFASGREDVDALMLGTGRPFYVEVKFPRRRETDFPSLGARVLSTSGGGVEVIDLSLANQTEVEEMKVQKPDKTYEVGLVIEGGEVATIAEKLEERKGIKISQRTPNRVLGIRKDKIRERTIRSIEIKSFEGNNLVLVIRAEAGTYIKEFVTGDNGRTVPNLRDELDVNVKIEYLNVLEVKQGI